ncbi:MAG: hypothetical protein AB7S75_16180 [Desulfococcaceae bacterium]
MMTRIFIFFLIIFCSGCTTTIKSFEQKHTFQTNENDDKEIFEVFIINGEQYSKEYEILSKSGKFKISDNHEAPHLYLEKMDKLVSPMQMLDHFGTFFTLGLLPSSSILHYDFEFTIEHEGKLTGYRYFLTTIMRCSIWEWFRKPFVNEIDILAACLRNSKRIE